MFCIVFVPSDIVCPVPLALLFSPVFFSGVAVCLTIVFCCMFRPPSLRVRRVTKASRAEAERTGRDTSTILSCERRPSAEYEGGAALSEYVALAGVLYRRCSTLSQSLMRCRSGCGGRFFRDAGVLCG